MNTQAGAMAAKYIGDNGRAVLGMCGVKLTGRDKSLHHVKKVLASSLITVKVNLTLPAVRNEKLRLVSIQPVLPVLLKRL